MSGEMIVNGAAWLAMIGYTASLLLQVQGTCPSRRDWARYSWSLGALFFLIHTGSAFAVHHQWSHQAALAHVAQQAESVTGLKAGWGLYVNYLFGGIWIFESVRWLCREKEYRTRPRWQFVTLHGFFLLMVLNGAFVFVSSPARWFGLGLTLLASGAFFTILIRPSHHD